MFCPQCRSEYRPGFTRCSDCDVDLVWELPRDAHAEHDEPNLVKAFETGNPALIPIVQSLLEDAKIECVIKNPRDYDVFNTNPLLGPAEFWVREDEADAARELLDDLVRYDGAQGRE
jgi:hypothetical protein